MKQFLIPWAAWHEQTVPTTSGAIPATNILTFPEHWDVEMVSLKHIPPLTSEAIDRAFETPTGVSPLRDIISRNGKRIAIAIDDLTRPACLKPVTDLLINKLKQNGISRDDIQIIVAVAAHKPLTFTEVAKKIGNEAAKKLKVVNHHPESDLENVPIGDGKTVPLNRRFIRSDIKMVIGTVMPHFYAGYSGGAKIIIPGLAGIDAILNTHKSVLMGLSGKLRQIDGNRFRNRIESIAKAVGVDFAIQIVVGPNREIVGIFTGDIISAHREAVHFAEKIYISEFPKNLDIVILNAYPKDTELLQIENAFVAYRSAQNLVKPEGTIVITSACSEGLGVHGLFQPGKPLYRQPRPHGFLENRHVIVMAPGITQKEFYSLFHSSNSFHQGWQGVIKELKQRYTQSCKVGIFPYSPLQMSMDIVSSVT